MKNKSEKVLRAEKFVDEHIKKHAFPPTYKQVKEYMGFKSDCQSYVICKKFRGKMKRIKNIKKITIEVCFDCPYNQDGKPLRHPCPEGCSKII